MKESKKKKTEVKTSMTSTVEKRGGGAEEIIKSNFGDDKRYLKIRR